MEQDKSATAKATPGCATRGPVVVAGLGRCGSSMVMKMLKVGGLKLTSAGVGEPLYEDDRISLLPYDPGWLRQLGEEHAVKLLHADKLRPPRWFKCRVIWLDRNITEQVKSTIKYRMVKQKGDVTCKMSYAKKNFRKKTDACVKMMKKLAGDEFMRISFEEILREPAASAERIAAFVGGLDAVLMASVVRKRQVECLPNAPDLAHPARVEGMRW